MYQDEVETDVPVPLPTTPFKLFIVVDSSSCYERLLPETSARSVGECRLVVSVSRWGVGGQVTNTRITKLQACSDMC